MPRVRQFCENPVSQAPESGILIPILTLFQQEPLRHVAIHHERAPQF